MRSVISSFKYAVPIVLLTLMLSACERPLQSDESTEIEEFTSSPSATEIVDEQPTDIPDATVTEDVEEQDQVIEPDSESSGQDTEAGQADVEVVETTPPESEKTEEEELSSGTDNTSEVEPPAVEVVEATETPVFQEADAEEPTAEPDLGSETPTPTEEVAAGIEEEDDATDVSGEDSAGSNLEGDATEQTEETTESLPRTHTVKVSDNLYRIGLQYGVSWVAIAEYNNLIYPYYIYAGDVLQIPGGSSTEAQQPEAEESTTPTNYLDYTVQYGDTLAKIGQQFAVSPEAIIEVNGIINPNLIYAGQILNIPTTSPETQESITHVVQWGETLSLIALRYGVQWLSIAEANGILPPYVVYAGQTLVIPGG